ncbi:hypothetical protein CDD83_10913 [Cordyceps sp. RAO-2017]|nr:hypothetical protein CDD83_10913 [Cordyceps sp. RAO-2017]
MQRKSTTICKEGASDKASATRSETIATNDCLDNDAGQGAGRRGPGTGFLFAPALHRHLQSRDDNLLLAETSHGSRPSSFSPTSRGKVVTVAPAGPLSSSSADLTASSSSGHSLHASPSFGPFALPRAPTRATDLGQMDGRAAVVAKASQPFFTFLPAASLINGRIKLAEREKKRAKNWEAQSSDGRSLPFQTHRCHGFGLSSSDMAEGDERLCPSSRRPFAPRPARLWLHLKLDSVPRAVELARPRPLQCGMVVCIAALALRLGEPRCRRSATTPPPPSQPSAQRAVQDANETRRLVRRAERRVHVHRRRRARAASSLGFGLKMLSQRESEEARRARQEGDRRWRHDTCAPGERCMCHPPARIFLPPPAASSDSPDDASPAGLRQQASLARSPAGCLVRLVGSQETGSRDRPGLSSYPGSCVLRPERGPTCVIAPALRPLGDDVRSDAFHLLDAL